MKTHALFLFCLLGCFVSQPMMAQEFPIGAYIHKPDTAEYRRCNFTWAVMMTDFFWGPDTNEYYYQNASRLKIIAMRRLNIYDRSIAQRLLIQPQTLSKYRVKNSLLRHETGELTADGWWAKPGKHSAGHLVRLPLPFWQFRHGAATLNDSFRIKIAFPERAHKPVVTLLLVDHSSGDTLSVKTLYSDTHFHDDAYHLFSLDWRLDSSRHGAQPSRALIAGEISIDVLVYWHGEVETWLDQILLDDEKESTLFRGGFDEAIIKDASQFKSSTRYPLLKRFMLHDEPPIHGFHAFRYVDKILQSVRPDGQAEGRGRGWTANNLDYMRFLQEAQPFELAVNLYPLGPSLPSPSLTDQAADSLGIPHYRYQEYTKHLQAVLDSMVGVERTYYGDYSWDKGLRPAIEATKRIGSKKGFWFIPQLHGILWRKHGGYAPPPRGYSGLRNPTPNEIRVMVFMSLAYGAKGIIYYPYSTTYDHTRGLENWNTGLVKRSEGLAFEDDHSSNYGLFLCGEEKVGLKPRRVFTGYKEKWSAVQQINAKLQQLGPILADTNLVWQDAASIHKGQIDNLSKVIESLYTLNADDQQDSYPEATFAEVGYLLDVKRNWEYLMVVNRRCVPIEKADDRRKMKIKLKKGSGSWQVQEMPAGESWILPHNGVFTTHLFDPGEGRLYRVTPYEASIPYIFIHF